MTYNVDEAKLIANWLAKLGVKVDFEKERIYHNRHAIYCSSEANLARTLFLIADIVEKLTNKSITTSGAPTTTTTTAKV